MGSGFVRFSISTGIYIISGTDRNDSFYGTIFEVGVLIFEQLLLTGIFVNLVEQAKTRSELEVYERLLKEDRMTGINNRTAFEEQLQDIEDHAQDYDNAALIFMDVDGLKIQTIFMDIMQGTN